MKRTGRARQTVAEWLRRLSAGLQETVDDFRLAWRKDLHGSHGPGASAIGREIADRQFLAMVRELPNNLLATGAGAVLWLIAMGSVAPSAYLVLWGVLACGTVVSGGFSYARFMRAPPIGEALGQWKRGFRRDLSIVGLIWGSIMFAPAPPEVVPYMTIGMLLVVAGSVSLFVADRPSISLLAVPCALLTTTALVLRGDALHAATGVGFAVAVALLIRLSRVHNTSITQAMFIAEERRSLLDELGARRREAEAASAAKTCFLASVSHDLRQPMQSIALLVAKARESGRAEPELVEQIGASVQSMDDLLGALLEVSKLDAGAVPLQLSAFPVAEVLEQVRLKFEPQARAKELHLQVDASPHHVRSDFFQLERIVSNLVSNAIRYTPRGGVRVRCRQRGPLVWVQVWDSGVGIARRHRRRVFDEFFQVARTAHTGKQGLGLGLSIVQRTAQRLNHPVRLRSREGRGTVFEVGIGIATPREQDAARLAPWVDGRLILVVDDDDTVRGSMSAMLGAFDCHVLSAASVDEALRVVDETLRLPDLIISDYRLSQGGPTGREAVEQVRALAGEAIPALIVSAELRVCAADSSLQASGIPVLPKPLRADALAAALERLFLTRAPAR